MITTHLSSNFDTNQLHTDYESRLQYGSDWTGTRTSLPEAVFFPTSVEDVQKIVRLANEQHFGLVPSGGRTGLSGGAIAGQGEVVVSFDKMCKILDFNDIDKTITVEAGVTTKAIQDFAASKSLYYPLDFASKGSSQIGGNVATNAGGVRVVRYGNTRQWVRGLKVVAGQGDVLECNRGLLKDASGYDLRHLFIGSEGTLGFVVEVELGLCALPKDSCVALLAVTEVLAIIDIFKTIQKSLVINAFEVFSKKAKEKVCDYMNTTFPLETSSDVFLLLEWEGEIEDFCLLLEFLYKSNFIQKDIITKIPSEKAHLWSFRENIPLSFSHQKPFKSDVSVKPSKTADFLKDFEKLLYEKNGEIIWFGHIGDGNLHLNILKPNDETDEAFSAKCVAFSTELYKLVASYGGSASAEHGIGLLKKNALAFSRGEAEIDYLKGIKQVFDPKNIMNRGKMF